MEHSRWPAVASFTMAGSECALPKQSESMTLRLTSQVSAGSPFSEASTPLQPRTDTTPSPRAAHVLAMLMLLVLSAWESILVLPGDHTAANQVKARTQIITAKGAEQQLISVHDLWEDHMASGSTPRATSAKPVGPGPAWQPGAGTPLRVGCNTTSKVQNAGATKCAVLCSGSTRHPSRITVAGCAHLRLSRRRPGSSEDGARRSRAVNVRAWWSPLCVWKLLPW